MKFRLRDDGQPPDAVAGDGIWSLDVWPPFLAPAGEFTIELTGYDKSNNVVLVKTEHGVAPLQRTCRVTITHGEEGPPLGQAQDAAAPAAPPESAPEAAEPPADAPAVEAPAAAP